MHQRVKRLKQDYHYRSIVFATGALLVNLSFALYHGIFGILTQSYWFIVMFAYYTTLSVMRFCVVYYGWQKRNGFYKNGKIAKMTGYMLLVLAMILLGSLFVSQTQNTAIKYPEVLMISIATYTTYKVVTTICRSIKLHKQKACILMMIGYIGCCDAMASILSLQRSMLATFSTMELQEMYLLCDVSGIIVCFIVFMLGIYIVTIKRRV